MLIRSPLKEKFRSSEPVIGTWFTMGSPLVAETLACSGLDFIIIDFEHGPFQLDQVHDYVNRCENHGCAPIVRIPANESWMALQALDQGAHGVLVPQINDAKQARRLIDAVKYHPIGERGFTPFTKAGGFTNEAGSAYPETANELTICAVLVESREGLENLDEILAEPEIDVVYFGAYDLSQSFGEPGNVRHPDIVKAIGDAAGRTRLAGKAAGGFVAESQQDVAWLRDMGMSFITFGVDSAMLLKSFAATVEWFGKGSRS